MMRLTRFAAVAAVLALAAGPAAAQDTIDNPEFASWSKFKKGTAVTLKSNNEVMKNKREIITTTTLIEIAADKLVLETSSVSTENGMEFKEPAKKRDVPKTTMLPAGVKKEDFAIGKPPGTTEEGTETMKLAGTEVKTRWYKFSKKMDGVTAEGKVWVSDDVPGMQAKGDLSASAGELLIGRYRIELFEIKKP